MNWTGLIAAIGTFLLIGSFHVIVIKTEYYFGKQVWPVFAGVGIFSLLASLLISNMIISVLIAVFGITCIWSIKELFEQEERVKKDGFRKIRRKSRNKKNQNRTSLLHKKSCSHPFFRWGT